MDPESRGERRQVRTSPNSSELLTFFTLRAGTGRAPLTVLLQEKHKGTTEKNPVESREGKDTNYLQVYLRVPVTESEATRTYTLWPREWILDSLFPSLHTF